MADVESQFECQRNATTRSHEPDATHANDDASSAMKQPLDVELMLKGETLVSTHNRLS